MCRATSCGTARDALRAASATTVRQNLNKMFRQQITQPLLFLAMTQAVKELAMATLR
jgi:hypothetical protein